MTSFLSRELSEIVSKLIWTMKKIFYMKILSLSHKNINIRWLLN